MGSRACAAQAAARSDSWHLGLPSEVPAAHPARAPRSRAATSPGDQSSSRPRPSVAATRLSRHTLYGASAFVAGAAGGSSCQCRPPAVTGQSASRPARRGRHLLCGRRIFDESRRDGPITPVPLPPRPRSSRLSSEATRSASAARCRGMPPSGPAGTPSKLPAGGPPDSGSSRHTPLMSGPRATATCDVGSRTDVASTTV